MTCQGMPDVRNERASWEVWRGPKWPCALRRWTNGFQDVCKTWVEYFLELGKEVDHPCPDLLEPLRGIVYGPVGADVDGAERVCVMPQPLPFRTGAGIDAALDVFLLILQPIEDHTCQLVVVGLNVETHRQTDPL